MRVTGKTTLLKYLVYGGTRACFVSYFGRLIPTSKAMCGVLTYRGYMWRIYCDRGYFRRKGERNNTEFCVKA